MMKIHLIYYEIAHSLLSVLSVREDLGEGARKFSRKHPLACWSSTMLALFAGGMIVNALLGESPLAPLQNTRRLIVRTTIWYVVFYMPLDLGYKVGQFLPVKMVASVLNEVYRVKNIYDGVSRAAEIYPNGVFTMILIGTLRGNGAIITKLLERFIRGAWASTVRELLEPNFYTVTSLAASIIFVLKAKTDWIEAPDHLVCFFIVVFLAGFKVSSMLLDDPFDPLNILSSSIFFGETKCSYNPINP